MPSTPTFSGPSDDLNGLDVHCSMAQTSNLLYSRNYDQTRPFREQNMHGRFAYLLQGHYVYAVLTGFDDINAVRYYTAVLQMVISDKIQHRTPNLDSQQQEDFYTKLLKDAFATVEEQFVRKMSDPLSEKAVFDIELHGNNPENYPTINDRLKELSRELSSGLSAVVALIYDGRIYVANTGDTQAILCKKVVNNAGQDCIRAVQLSTTHDLDNVNELRRLNQLGINTDLLRQKHEIGNMCLTRCLGNLWLKSFYKDFPDLASATQDPILAEPDISSIPMDQSSLFLILASATLIDTLHQVMNKTDVTEDLIKMAFDEFQADSNRESLAQSVLNQICELHQNCFTTSSNFSRPTCRQIEDITLLVRDLTVEAHENANSVMLTNVNREFGELNISVEDHYLGSNSTLQDTRKDIDKTITDRRASHSQRNLTEDSGQQNDDEEEIEAYVDFKELLQAYNEIPVESN